MEFDTAVAAVQIGSVIARDRKALDRWRNRRRRGQTGKSGAALEHAVMSLHMRNPEYVVIQ